MHSLWFKNSALMTVVALGAIGASLAPASAHNTTTRCDRDGDQCYTVRCDDDGDNCRRVSSYQRYNYDRRDYRGGDSNGYAYGDGDGRYNDNRGYNRYHNDSYGRLSRRGDNEDE